MNLEKQLDAEYEKGFVDGYNMAMKRAKWEEEFEKIDAKKCGCCTALSKENLKAFIQKVHDEAYERGYDEREQEIQWDS